MSHLSTDPYVICSTPRTGSTLLCGLLESTGLAGRPKSYFRQQDEQSWVTSWNIPCSPEGVFDYADYVQATLAAGRTDNGVFAVRIMWGTLDELVYKLRIIYPELSGDDVQILNRALGHSRYIYLRRTDVIAQAVSWCRAEQTNIWHTTDRTESVHLVEEPQYNFSKIHQLVQTLNDHNMAWQKWFLSVGIQPYHVQYEDLDANPIDVTRDILDFLKIKLLPEHQIQVRNQRMADDISKQWIDRYQSDRQRYKR